MQILYFTTSDFTKDSSFNSLFPSKRGLNFAVLDNILGLNIRDAKVYTASADGLDKVIIPEACVINHKYDEDGNFESSSIVVGLSNRDLTDGYVFVR